MNLISKAKIALNISVLVTILVCIINVDVDSCGPTEDDLQGQGESESLPDPEWGCDARKHIRFSGRVEPDSSWFAYGEEDGPSNKEISSEFLSPDLWTSERVDYDCELWSEATCMALGLSCCKKVDAYLPNRATCLALRLGFCLDLLEPGNYDYLWNWEAYSNLGFYSNLWGPSNTNYLWDRTVSYAESQRELADMTVFYQREDLISVLTRENNVRTDFAEETLELFLETNTLKRDVVVVFMGIGTLLEHSKSVETVGRLEAIFNKHGFKKIVFIHESSLGPDTMYREWANGRHAYGVWGRTGLFQGEIEEELAPEENVDLTLVWHRGGTLAIKHGVRFGLEAQALFTIDVLPNFLEQISVNKDFALVLMDEKTRDWPFVTFRRSVDELEKILKQQEFKRVIFRFE